MCSLIRGGCRVQVVRGGEADLLKEEPIVGTRPIQVGLLGAGEVAGQYLPNLLASDQIELVGVGDLDHVGAERLAQVHHIPKVFPGEEILNDKGIDLIVNLTPIPAHFDTSLRILEAGKHLYSEKPLALSAEKGSVLLATAERMGLSIGCAPDTVLGVGFQTARRALERGVIGNPLSASASMLRPLPVLNRHRTGAIPLFNMAPYYLSALINLFGPVTSVAWMSRLCRVPTPSDQRPIFASGSLRFKDDVLCDLTLRWGGTPSGEVPVLKVFGTQGVLCFPNPDTFSAGVRWRRHGEGSWRWMSEEHSPDGRGVNRRGVGVADMAQAIRQGRTPRAAADVALHVVEIVEKLSLPGPGNDASGGWLQTGCDKPALL